MHFTVSVVVSSLVLSAWHVIALQVVKRGSFEVLLRRQATTSTCSPICAPFQSALTSCTTAACLCTNTIANNVQQCVNCALEGNTDPTVLTSAEQLVSDFELVCGSFPIPTVTLNTAGGVPTSTSARPSPTTSFSSASGTLTPTALPASSAFSTGGLVTTTVTSLTAPFSLPTTIEQVTIGPSDDSGASATATSPSTSSSGAVTFGGLTSEGSKRRIVDGVLMTMCGALSMVLMV